MIPTQLAFLIASKLDEYLHSARDLVERWFNPEAYAAACREAAAVRKLLGQVPALLGHTVQILSCHDALVGALWRSSSDPCSDAFNRVRHWHERLCARVGVLREECLVQLSGQLCNIQVVAPLAVRAQH